MSSSSSSSSSSPPARPDRMLTFASGGWVLVATGLLAIVILVMTVGPAVGRWRSRPPGDGKDPASFGFDLATSLLPPGSIVAGRLHRDLLPPIVAPELMPGAGVQAENRERYGKYLVPTDRVIGVAAGGEARAYPLLLLKLHEVANDVVGGRPVLVAYNPLCDSAAVFERPPGADGSPRVFGTSGLLWNSAQLLYDRAPAAEETAAGAQRGGESLWSPLQRRAVTGPAAVSGARLEPMPCALVRWGDWLAAHPDTTVLAPPADLKRYHETAYDAYFRSPELLFPVDPVAPTDRLALKTPCIVVDAGGARRLYAFPDLAARCGPTGTWTDTLGGTPVTFQRTVDPETIRVIGPEGAEPPIAAYAFWFAWYAQAPELF